MNIEILEKRVKELRDIIDNIKFREDFSNKFFDSVTEKLKVIGKISNSVNQESIDRANKIVEIEDIISSIRKDYAEKIKMLK